MLSIQPDTRKEISGIRHDLGNPFGVIDQLATRDPDRSIWVLDTYAKSDFLYFFLVSEMGMVKGIASPYSHPTPKKNQIFWNMSVFGVRSMVSKVVV